MRRAEIKLDQVYAELTGDRRNLNPVLPVSVSPGLALFYEHTGQPIVRRQTEGARQRPSAGIWPHSGAWMRNIGLRFPGEGFEQFEVWAGAQGAPEHRPGILDVALKVAARLRQWFDTIPDGTEQPVPDGIVHESLRLVTFASREVIGDWLTRRGDQIVMDREKRVRESLERLAQETRRNEFALVADRMLRLFDVSEVKPGREVTQLQAGCDFYGRTDYTKAQLPLDALVKLLDEVEDARDHRTVGG